MCKKALLKACLSFIMLGMALSSCKAEVKTSKPPLAATLSGWNCLVKFHTINFRPEITKEIKTFQKFELAFDLEEIPGNPFNSEDIEVTAIFYSPKGEEINLPCFFYQDYKRELKNGNESLIAGDTPCWKGRFTPAEKGTYYYQVHVKTRHNTYQSKRRKLEVIPQDALGFIRVSPEAHRYFEFDSGMPYFAIGHNLCWYSSSHGTYDYDYYFPKMEEAKENYTRIWLCPWSFALEWKGLATYNLADAWRLDYVLSLAEKKGIYIMFCIDTFNTLNSTSSYEKWSSNPYKKDNGGPCAEPEEFFTDSKAKGYYKNKLRYIIARWGYSPNILAWELWNEVDFTDNYSSENIRNWHTEMIQYLHNLDPHNHLITTSYFQNLVDTQMWQLPEIDFTQSRAYGSDDIALSINELCSKMNSLYTKPHLVAEFALTHSDQDSDLDPKGYYLHDGIWSAAFSLSTGTAMSWWWDSHIDKNNLYYHFKAIAEFVKDIEWTKENYNPIQVRCYKSETPDEVLPVNIYGLINKDCTNMLLWIQNKGNSADLFAEIVNLKTGKYLLQWWDTYQGKVLKNEEIKCADGKLVIEIPPFNRDCAAKITLSQRQISIDNTTKQMNDRNVDFTRQVNITPFALQYPNFTIHR